MSTEEIKTIQISKIVDSPYQARFLSIEDTEDMLQNKAIGELAGSISVSGLLQLVTVRQVGENYELIDGHRRVLAHKLLGKHEIQAIVKEMDDRLAQILCITANLQRKNLNPIELALAYKKMLETGLFSDKKQLSISLGKDETYVGDVLNTLNMDKRIVEDLIHNSSIKDVKMLRLIRQIDDVDENQISEMQWNLYERVISNKLSRQQVSDYLKELFGKKQKKVYYKLAYDKKALRISLNLNAFEGHNPETIIKFVTDNLDKLDTFLTEKKKK